MNVRKIYLTAGGSSTGGDPHVATYDGKSVIITPESEFLLLKTNFKNESNVEMRCTSFTLSKNLDLISAYQAEKVDTSESYLRYLTIVISNKEKEVTRKIKVDMVNLSLFNSFSENSDGEEECTITIKEIFDSSFPKIRSKIFSQYLLLFREITLNFKGNKKISLELIRTECINYSDINVLFTNFDPLTCEGVAINGIVKFFD